MTDHAFALKKRKAQCTTVGEPENTMNRRKALLSKVELLVTKERDKVCKASKRASETCKQTEHILLALRVLHFSLLLNMTHCLPCRVLVWSAK